ncbi:MAG: hypothetical protein ACYSWS_06815, partial [Planctomycetota bacterium]
MINKKSIKFISTLLVACVATVIVLVSGKAVFAQLLEPDPMFLELESIYRGDKEYKELPFELNDPHKRSKNGPTLKNVIHKANKEWLKKWINNPPEMVPNARMPRLM